MEVKGPDVVLPLRFFGSLPFCWLAFDFKRRGQSHKKCGFLISPVTFCYLCRIINGFYSKHVFTLEIQMKNASTTLCDVDYFLSVTGQSQVRNGMLMFKWR